MLQLNRIVRPVSLLIRVTAATACLGTLLTSPAAAYMGPGAGLTAIGSFVALVGAIFLMIVGFVWYPIRRLLRRRKTSALAPGTPPETPDA